ncbi:MAG: class I SAM-dependent methyltransferase [Bacteroidetes bacterium]|nr:class I SAM-dependent methyltransferase [Bacteroidota bacterium]
MKKWYKTWFSSDEYLNVYNHRDSQDAENIINLILTQIPLPQNAVILDAACGAGRHAIILSKLGYKVIAFDLSTNLLKIGQKNSVEHQENVHFFCSDIRQTYIKKKVDLITNLFTSFGYFENDDENFIFFHNSKSLLKKDGFVVFDYFNSNHVKNNLIENTERVINSKRIIEERRIEDNFVIKKIVIEENGNNSEFYERVKLYDSEFLIKKFSEIGFTIEKSFGNYNGAEFNQNKSKRMVLFLKNG